jgi:hypothetical protein
MFKKYFNPKENPNIYFLFPCVAFIAVGVINRDFVWVAIAFTFFAISISK